MYKTILNGLILFLKGEGVVGANISGKHFLFLFFVLLLCNTQNAMRLKPYQKKKVCSLESDIHRMQRLNVPKKTMRRFFAMKEDESCLSEENTEDISGDILLLTTNYNPFIWRNYIDVPFFNDEIELRGEKCRATIGQVRDGMAAGGIFYLIHLKSGKKIASVSVKEMLNTPQCSFLGEDLDFVDNVKMRVIQKEDTLLFEIDASYADRIVQYDLIKEVFEEKLYHKKALFKKKYAMKVSPGTKETKKKICHDNYDVKLMQGEQEKSLCINHYTSLVQDKEIILEDTKRYSLFASPHKRKSYLLAYSSEKRYRFLCFFPYYYNELVLYDSQEGEKIKEFDVQNTYINIHEKKLIGAVFSQKRPFVVLVFDNVFILYDLNWYMPVGICECEQSLKKGCICLSRDEMQIMVASGKDVFRLDNPMRSICLDETERLQCLFDQEDEGLEGDKTINTFSVCLLHNQSIKVASKIFLLS